MEPWKERRCKRQRGVLYVRYMGNIVLLARTRWQLRRAIATLPLMALRHL